MGWPSAWANDNGSQVEAGNGPKKRRGVGTDTVAGSRLIYCGDPMSPCKWLNARLRDIQARLAACGLRTPNPSPTGRKRGDPVHTRSRINRVRQYPVERS